MGEGAFGESAEDLLGEVAGAFVELDRQGQLLEDEAVHVGVEGGER